MTKDISVLSKKNVFGRSDMADSRLTAHEARQQLYDIVRRETPFEQKARDALDLGKNYLDADNGHLTRIDTETDHWEAVVSTDSPDGTFPAGMELDLGTTYCRRTIESQTPVALHDAPSQGWGDDLAFETHNLHCYHGTTLMLDNEPYGTVCFVAEDSRSQQFSDGETMFAELLTRLLERELERKQHEDQLTRQTNLVTVLNRVLRHNLRNKMSVIRGYTQLMADKLEDDPYSETTLNNIDNLLDLSQKARELDRIVTADFERESTDIVSLVDGLVERVGREYPSASIFLESDTEIIAAVLPSFEQALEELIENAAKHGGETPTVTVTVEVVPNAVEIRITDDGPGLDAHEVNVLKTGEETVLTHGGGLGLWLVHWIVSSHDGSVDATVTEEGTTMTVTVPRKPDTDSQEPLTRLTQARDQYQAAFENAHDAMVVLNDDARIVAANSEAARMYGMDRQELLGQPISRFLPDGFEFEDEWSEFQKTGTERDIVTFVTPDDEKRSVAYSATADIVPGQHLVISREVAT